MAASTIRRVQSKVQRESRVLVRKVSRRAAPVRSSVVRGLRSAPLPIGARVALSKALLRRPWSSNVAVNRLLLGAQNAHEFTAAQFAGQLDDLMWPSTRVAEGPHVALLRLADERGDELTDAEILDSPYGRMAMRCVTAQGHYFAATDADGVVAGARAFLSQYRNGSNGHRVNGNRPIGLVNGTSINGPVNGHHNGQLTGHPILNGRSRPGDPILVAPIKGSDHYQVLDGHHRVALAAVRGERTVRVTAKWTPVTTPLQDLLTRMSWLDGDRQLYQPLPGPELVASWPTVRRCTDRLAKMAGLLGERSLLPPATSSYLDVASCYGWFVSEMGKLGYAAAGMERDPLAKPLGQAAYGLDDNAVQIGDCVDLLRGADRRWDVVSCFSLLHHFVLGRGSVEAGELLRLLDKVTGRVMFLDTGQEHEEWFSESLRGWDTARVARMLRQHTTFDEVIDLGQDSDAVPPHERNYGRHLFACIRTGAR